MDFPLQREKDQPGKTRFPGPASARVIPSAKILRLSSACVELVPSICWMDSIKAPSSPLGSSAEQNRTFGTRQVKPGRKGRFCYRRFFPVWPSYNLSTTTPPSQLVLWQDPAEQECYAFNSQSTAGNFTGTIHSVIWRWTKGPFFRQLPADISTPPLPRCCRAIKWQSLTTGCNLSLCPQTVVGD